MLADRSFALAFEPAVQQSELPGGRGLLRQDAVTAAEEAQVFRLVGDLVQASQSRTDVEINMAQIVVLGAMKRMPTAPALPLPISKSILLSAE